MNGMRAQLLGKRLNQTTESWIRVKNERFPAKHQGALIHLLYENPVGMIGGLQGINLPAVRAFHDQRVHFAVADRAESVVGLAELPLQSSDLRLCDFPSHTPLADLHITAESSIQIRRIENDSHEHSQWPRKLPDQGGYRYNLGLSRELRIDIDIHNTETILSGRLFFAGLFYTVDSSEGTGTRSCHEEP